MKLYKREEEIKEEEIKEEDQKQTEKKEVQETSANRYAEWISKNASKMSYSTFAAKDKPKK